MGLRAFTFDGTSSSDFGMFITEASPYNAPERAVEMIEIPGRNGAYALDKGNFENVEQTYHVVVHGSDDADFREMMSDVRNWLCSKVGYCRLSDDYNPGEYRMATYKSGLETDSTFWNGTEFDVTFDCKPQRYLAIGEELIEIGAWGNTETAEGEVVTIEASSDTAVKALTADISPIQDLHGYDAPWVGGSHYNKWDEEWEVGFIDPNSGQNSSQYSTMIRSKNYIPCSPNTAYFFKASANASNGMFFYDSSKNYLSKDFPSKDTVFTTPNNAYYIRFCMAVAYGTTYKNDIAINYPSTVTTYSPYENICPISGHDEVDVVRTGKNLLPNIKYQEASTRVQVGSTGDFSIILPAGTYKYSASAVAGATAYWKKQGGVVQIFNNNMVLTETSAVNIWYYKSGGLSTDDIDWFQLELGTTATDYEPYNGTTYTTTLPTTTYGGTLDLVSGLLTVDRAITSGALDWTRMSSSYQYGTFQSDAIADLKYSANSPMAICSCYAPSTAQEVESYDDGVIWARSSSGYRLVIKDTSKENMTAADFKTFMADKQIVYKLATPQTYQLTPQQVELLLGENHVFADSGNVTVEYGHNPTLLTNPTWFPSKPLLAVDGYGEIKFNNRSIAKLENVTIGNVQVAQSQTGNDPLSVTINSDLLNTSDEFVVSGAEVYLDYTHNQLGSFYGGITINSVTNGTAITNDITSRKITVVIKPNDITFTKGTSASTTVTVDHTIHYIVGGTQGTIDETAEAVIAYDGDKTISYSVTLTPALVSNFIGVKYRELSPDIYGQSSISALGNPTYIDCEAGECYMVNSADEVVSLNNNIDLGSDLPELQSGDTEVTYDNTITKVEVKPNWWKV